MRKDSINVFNEGLNYDLNPITTPNNVLTDCINGTFITFNGDELALQNDAGNTKVSYKTSEAVKNIFWTINESEEVNSTFNWRTLPAEHNVLTSFVTSREEGFKFLYLSVPQNSLFTLYNELDILLYDSTLSDSLEDQLFYFVGTAITSTGATNNIYRKKSVYNTGNAVLFKIKLFYLDYNQLINQEGIVQLSPGFIPLGVKEHGGVLYIISGKLPQDNVPKWNDTIGYAKDQIVYNDTLIKTYYLSKVNNNRTLLPIESNEYWEVIGTTEDFVNYFGEVEFGSYPSPKFSGNTIYDGNTITYLEQENQELIINDLYIYKTINNEIFKTGRYVVFEGSNIPPDGAYYISTYQNGDYIPKFYKIKLYNQLNNGYLDLTPDIWDKYLLHSPGGFWFDDNTFKYYCPNQYKGKLALRLEIEDLKQFELEGMSLIEYDNIGETYTFKATVLVDSDSYIQVPNVIVQVRIEGQLNWSEEFIVPVVDKKAIFQYTGIDNINTNKLIEYLITPIFEVDSENITEKLPHEYISKYIIRGRRIISTDLDFNFVEEDHECNNNTLFKTSKIVSIKNINGVYIDYLFNESQYRHIFILDGETPEVDDVVLATYQIGTDGYPIIITLEEDYQDYIELVNLFKNTYKVYAQSLECNYTVLTLNFNLDWDLCSMMFMTIKQGANSKLYSSTILQQEGLGFNNIQIQIQPNVYTEISVNRPGFEPITDAFFPTQNLTRNYAFICNIVPSYMVWNDPSFPFKHYLYWDGTLTNLPVVDSLTYRYYKAGESPLSVDMVMTRAKNTFIFEDYCNYQSNHRLVKNNNFTLNDTFTLFGSGQQFLTESYNNISNNLNFRVVPGWMFDCGTDCNSTPSGPPNVNLIFRYMYRAASMITNTPGGNSITVEVVYVPIQQGYGNGLGGRFFVDSTEYIIPMNFPQTTLFTHGPVVPGTYYIDPTMLISYVNGAAYDSLKTYIIVDDPTPAQEVTQPFPVTVVDRNIFVRIYVEPNYDGGLWE